MTLNVEYPSWLLESCQQHEDGMLMTTLVVGASGATGRLLVHQLLQRGEPVKIIVRAGSELPPGVDANDRVSIVRESILEINDADLQGYVKECTAIASCLGHNMSFKGIFGEPRRLVTDAIRRLCGAIVANRPDRPIKFVLMNTSGNRNGDLSEPVSLAEKGVSWLLRALLPPFVDNEEAAEFLRTEIGQNDRNVEWVVVRPDSLIDEDQVSGYEEHLSPQRSAIFNAGTTSRINVAHFMAELTTNEDLWRKWKGKMPVIYNNS
jgi:hypothetical protein